MTCIVALEHDHGVVLGSDSFLGDSSIRDQISRPKFFTKGPGFLIAFSGGLRGAQLVEHGVTFRKIRNNEDEEAYLVTEVSKKLHDLFSKRGANIEDNGFVDTHDAEFLVVINKKIFIIQDDYSVVRSKHRFAAVGAGQNFALGALAFMEKYVRDSATTVSKTLSNRERVRLALEAAAEFSPQVCDPFYIVEV